MNQLDFRDRTAVITGGAMGIGFAIAQRLAASGAKVSLWDRDAAALAKAQSSLGAATDTRVVDVADAASVEAAATATAAAVSRIDVLVCSAGITGPNTPLAQYPLDAWRQVIDINLNGLFYCNRAIVPIMQQRDYARTANITSVPGKVETTNPRASTPATTGQTRLTTAF